MKATGTYITPSAAGESFQAFVPNPLPPDPPLQLDQQARDLIEKANRALGRLDGITTLLPDVSLLLYFYVRKEAVLSSQIEGGLKRLREDRFPLSLRLIREMHKVLMSRGRGSDKNPGRFRRSQNWLGGTRPGNARFVPPPPERVIECMGNLEKFLHDQPQRTGVLIKAALSHVQFETIHPFLDGNGRLGRLLITHILCAEGVLQQPLLYLSLFFKQHRAEYYDRLDAVRLKGDWLGWLRFFLEGVDKTAGQAADTATRILELFDEDRSKIETLGRKAASAHRLHELLRRHPITTIPSGAKQLKLTAPTVRSAIASLGGLGIVREITGKQRDRAYVYDRYLQILDEGTEPISA